MNEKKNIDRLFQEKFKDFEVAPPDFVWQNIEAELQEKKKKRRILPLWFRLSGVAAILVIGMFIAGPFIDGGISNDKNNPVVLDTQETNPDGSPRLKPTENPIRQSQSVETAVAEDASQPKSSSAITDDKNKNTVVTPSVKENDAIVYRVKSEDARVKNSGKLRTKRGRLNNITVPHEEAVAQGPGNRNKHNAQDNSIATPATNQKQAVERDYKIRQATTPGIDKGESSVAGNNTIKPAQEKENRTVAQPENNIPKSEDNILPKGVNNAGIAAVETEVDTATTILPKNELEEMYQKKLKGEKEEETAVAEAEGKNRWKIKPQMAPLFFNSASEGSPIDADLAENSKSFDNDMSYGVGVNYAVTNRLSIRTGVNTVNMKYSTNDVEFSAALDNQQPTGTNFSADGPNGNLVIGSSQPASEGTSAAELSSQKLDGSLVQKMGFVEVPLEVSYKLVDRRFGIDLIGGVSTLFLNDNNVSLISDRGFRSNMGEANNLNNISFSTNVGVGFKYRIFDAFEASFEPMFKYQVNTFSNDAGNFKPYFIGLYSGISFSF
jgi:hypothetical protein